MKVRSKEQFHNIISEDFAWRKKELSIVRSRVDLAKSKQQDTEIRAAMLLLYAHWEGFNKTACDTYLEYVKQLKLNYSELSFNLLALSIKSEIVELESTNNHERHASFLLFIQNNFDNRAKWNLDKAIDTKSNLNSQILKNILSVVGINYNHFELKEKLIDEQLLSTRNTIAHGNYLLVDKKEYLSIHSEIIGLMQVVFDELSNSVTLEKYKKAPNNV